LSLQDKLNECAKVINELDRRNVSPDSPSYKSAIHNYRIVKNQIDIRGEDAIFDYDAARISGYIDAVISKSNRTIVKLARKYTTQEIESFLVGNPDLVHNQEDLKIFKEDYLNNALDPDGVMNLLNQEEFATIKQMLEM